MNKEQGQVRPEAELSEPEARRGCGKVAWIKPELTRFVAGQAETGFNPAVDGFIGS